MVINLPTHLVKFARKQAKRHKMTLSAYLWFISKRKLREDLYPNSLPDEAYLLYTTKELRALRRDGLLPKKENS